MRRTWLVAAILGTTTLIVAGAATPAAADHCFVVWVEPERGPVGTVFVIRQNGSDPGWVTLFHDGERIERHRLAGYRDEVRFVATAADVGAWRVHLRIPKGDAPCGPDDWFTVTGTPDTATIHTYPPRPQPNPGTAWLLAVAASTGAWLGLRRAMVRTACPSGGRNAAADR